MIQDGGDLETLEAMERGFRRKRRAIRVVTIVLASLVLVAGAVTLAFALRTTPEQKFRKSAFGKALAEPLTDYIADVARAPQRASQARKGVLTPAVEKQIGSEAFAALRRALETVRPAEQSTDDVDTAIQPLFAALDELDARLVDRRVPAFLSGYARGAPGDRGVWITSYYARQRSETTVEGASLRAVRGTRIDSLNLTDLTGWKAAASDWVLVSFDLVEEDFVRDLLKPIARHAPLGRSAGVPPEDHSPPAELAREATAAIAAEVYGASRLTPDDAAAAEDLLSRRNVAALELHQRGYTIDATDRLQLPRWMERALESSRGQAPQVDEMLHMEDALGAYDESFSTAVDVLAALEEQEFVVRLLEEKRLKDAQVDAFAAQSADSAELRAIASSELSKLARPQPCPRLALWRAAKWAYDAAYSGAAHRMAIAVLDALFRQLGLPGSAEWVGEGPLDEHFASALRAAMAKPPPDVQAAASRAYQEIFKRPPPAYAWRAL
jgi:hypothetical protein